MKRRIKYFLAILVVLFVSLAIYMQLDYEIAISEIQKKCQFIRNKKRVKYTPVIGYKLMMLFQDPESKVDRLIYQAAFIDCPNLEASGYHLIYMTHCYLTSQERESLIKIFNTDKHR